MAQIILCNKAPLVVCNIPRIGLPGRIGFAIIERNIVGGGRYCLMVAVEHKPRNLLNRESGSQIRSPLLI